MRASRKTRSGFLRRTAACGSVMIGFSDINEWGTQ
jgi:hypothetical protein